MPHVIVPRESAIAGWFAWQRGNTLGPVRTGRVPVKVPGCRSVLKFPVCAVWPAHATELTPPAGPGDWAFGALRGGHFEFVTAMHTWVNAVT